MYLWNNVWNRASCNAIEPLLLQTSVGRQFHTQFSKAVANRDKLFIAWLNRRPSLQTAKKISMLKLKHLQKDYFHLFTIHLEYLFGPSLDFMFIQWRLGYLFPEIYTVFEICTKPVGIARPRRKKIHRCKNYFWNYVA